MPHLTILEALLKLYAEFLEAIASSLDIIHCDGNMPKASRLGVAVVVWSLGERLRAMVVGELQNACINISLLTEVYPAWR